jgi:YfaZ precursor
MLNHTILKRAGARTALMLALAAAPALQAQEAPAPGGTGAATGDHAIEVYISEDAFQAQYLRDVRVTQLGATVVRAGVFYNEDRDLIAIGDLLAEVGGPEVQRRVQWRIGTRVYGAFLNIEDQDVFGIGIGGEAQYFLGRNRNASILLGAYYSPDILTFGLANNVGDATLRIQFRLSEGTDVFAGFRSFKIDTTTGGDRDVDDNLHVGFLREF